MSDKKSVPNWRIEVFEEFFIEGRGRLWTAKVDKTANIKRGHWITNQKGETVEVVDIERKLGMDGKPFGEFGFIVKSVDSVVEAPDSVKIKG